jgi:hypothetical protein
MAIVGVAALVALGAACRSDRAPTPEEARARGDALLAEMSRTLAATPAFSYTAEQQVERVRRGGEKVVERFTRRTVVQRPNRLAFTESGDAFEAQAWYDGTHFTIVSNRDKVWARGPMPGTLDEALDFVSAEYAVQIPTADLLYSTPIDALLVPESTGGWVGVETIGGQPCDHLSYHDPVVDWQIWLTSDARHLPRQLSITYKTQPGQPTARIAFSDWNEAPAIADATFRPAVPEGYQRIRLMRHATTLEEAPGPGKEAQR